MDYLLRYISAAVPAASDLSVVVFLPFHNGHTDLMVN